MTAKGSSLTEERGRGTRHSCACRRGGVRVTQEGLERLQKRKVSRLSALEQKQVTARSTSKSNVSGQYESSNGCSLWGKELRCGTSGSDPRFADSLNRDAGALWRELLTDPGEISLLFAELVLKRGAQLPGLTNGPKFRGI